MSKVLQSPETSLNSSASSIPQQRKYPFWLMPLLLIVYFGIATLLFFYWVNPSLTGENDKHITADSPRYIYFGESLRSGEIDPYVASALYSFPNTNWGPTLLAYLAPDTYGMMLINLGIFSLSLWFFSRAVHINPALFLLLLVLNPTTTISLLAVNKELLDLLSLSLFLYYLRHHNRLLLLLALTISLVSRFETCATILIFLFFRSRWNLWRGRRLRSLFAYCILLDLGMAFLLSLPSQASRLTEAGDAAGEAVASSGLLLMLNNLEIHFLFVVALVPKLLDNLFAEVFNVSHWFAFSMDDPANTFILFGNNLANLVIVVYLAIRRKLSIRSSIIYYATLIAITMSVSVVIQPRYFYGVYALLCLEGARRIQHTPSEQPGRIVNAVA
ncbi:hypothetical protein [Silvibacterium sp.]|uniref:hypothetical protein n=1 Tax=Silvibacterium sp. TaxID=1964179 RepID=UPI0039E4BC63